jgi:hypothetical protein
VESQAGEKTIPAPHPVSLSVGCIDYSNTEPTYISIWPELYPKDMDQMLKLGVPPKDLKESL